MANNLPTITGMEEIRANLHKFSYTIVNNGIVASTRAGAAVVVKQAKVNAMAHGFKKSGLLIRSIKSIRRRSDVPDGQVVFSVGILANKKSGKNNPFYWRFLEFGWHHTGSARSTRKNKIVGKQIPARPFIQPAGEQTKDTVVAAFKTKLATYLTKKGADNNE